MLALVFGQSAWAQTINAGGNAANLPVNGTSASATGTVSGNTLSVNVPDRAVIDWSSFNIGAGYTVSFGGGGGAVLNRVPLSSAANASSINGNLNGSGMTVMLMNPNGIMFGPGAVVNVGALVATTGTIDEDKFRNQNMAAITNATGTVRNQGRITAQSAGLVALVAPSVINEGTITATGGTLALAGTTAATISMNGGLYEFAVTGPGTEVTNAAGATLSGATLYLSTGDAANIVSGTINLSGVQQANRIQVDGNRVVLMSDLNAATVTGASRTIDVHSGAQVQDAVDIAASAATVNVYPGSYTETARSRDIGIPGIYDLGLLVNKSGLTLRGVDASGNPIASAADVQAWITAGTSTDFGMNHGVVADHVTIQGLGFKPYVPGANKTIEIAGDDFTFRNSVVDNRQVQGGAGALYFGELLSGHDIEKLTVTGSIFLDGSVSLTNGTGAAADGTFQPAADRVISGNTFTGSANYRFGGLLLTGKMDEIPWRPMPIGAATITGNSFSGFDESVLVRGEQQGVDLRQVMRDNAFDRSVLVTDAAGNARGEIYQSTPDGVHFTPRLKYSIQSSIQAGVDRAADGDTVTVGAGTYVQTATLGLHKSITFAGAGESQTIIDARGVAGNYGILVDADRVSLSDFTLYGPTANSAASYGIKVQPAGSGASARVRDFSITRVTSRGAFKAELDLNGVVGATIDGVTADGAPVGNDAGTTAGAGIQVTDSANVVIRNSTTRNNAWGGVALFQSNRFFDQQTTNISVDASNSLTETLPLYTQDESASRDFGALDIRGLPFAVRNDASPDSSQFTWFQKTLADALSFAAGLPNPGSSTVHGWNGTALTALPEPASPPPSAPELPATVPPQQLVPPVQVRVDGGTLALQPGPLADFMSAPPAPSAVASEAPAGNGVRAGGGDGAGGGAAPAAGGKGLQISPATGPGGGATVRSTPGGASESLDRGRSVEIDLSPGQ